MKHQCVPLFAQPLVRIDMNVSGVASFFDETIKTDDERSLRHYHNSDNVFHLYDELKPLGQEIEESANFVYREIMNYDSPLRITNAWLNECDIGGSQFMHNHCNAVLSGTLYIRTDQNTHIQFQNPFGISETVCNLVDNPNTDRINSFGYHFHFPQVTITVGNGVCLFWPSYLKHGYENNQTPNRLSLSFNLMPERFNKLYNPYFSS